jgi:hypothetical protein
MATLCAITLLKISVVPRSHYIIGKCVCACGCVCIDVCMCGCVEVSNFSVECEKNVHVCKRGSKQVRGVCVCVCVAKKLLAHY